MRKIGFLFAVAALGVPVPSSAEDSLFDSLAKTAGVVAPAPNPPDFVKASRPSAEPAEIPVFAAPVEPASKVKTDTELKAMDADLGKHAQAQAQKRPKAKPR